MTVGLRYAVSATAVTSAATARIPAATARHPGAATACRFLTTSAVVRQILTAVWLMKFGLSAVTPV
eukprot:6168010-Pyramimonas_sp.AAC.1